MTNQNEIKKPLALFDIDKTMFDGLSYFPLLEAQIEEGLVESGVGEQAQEAMKDYTQNSLGYEDFVKRLLDIYAQGLKDKSLAEVTAFTDNFFSKSPDFFGYVRPTIDLLAKTHEVVLVSGSSNFTASAVARVFNVSSYISTQLDSEQDRLNGRVKTYLATRHEKKEAIQHLTNTHPHAGSFGFGDSEGDIEMLHVVENPICIQPTAGLSKIASEKGWATVDSASELSSQSALSVVKFALNI
jgi:HAD superfamily hydrolase (TIGR01490 family)